MILVTVVTFVALISVFAFMVHIEYTNYFTYAQPQKFPEIIMSNASHLTVELVAKGLNSSNIAFLGLNDILVLDGNNGKVYRFINGQMLKDPLIDLNSFNQDGLIGNYYSEEPNWSTICFSCTLMKHQQNMVRM